MHRLIAGQKLNTISQKSALGPGLLLTGIVNIALVSATPFLPFWCQVVAWILITAVTLTVLAVFLIHSIRDPQLLRSEEYSLKHQALEMFGDGKTSAAELSKILASPAMSSEKYINGKQGS